jgi:hypothetical protein
LRPLELLLGPCRDEEPRVKFIIEAGLQKLEEYYQHVLEIPAYVLSAGE